MAKVANKPKKRKSAKKDYKVADIAEAAWGRREIELAEKEMPGLIDCNDPPASFPQTDVLNPGASPLPGREHWWCAGDPCPDF